MARKGNDDARSRAAEIERYKRAAEETLDQLDWCVNYLYRIRKDRIARVVQKNRSRIRQQMRGF
jgi:hypothetical protein